MSTTLLRVQTSVQIPHSFIHQGNNSKECLAYAKQLTGEMANKATAYKQYVCSMPQMSITNINKIQTLNL